MAICIQVLILSLCWLLTIYSKEESTSCDSNTILKGDLKCNENDVLYRTTVLFKGNDPLRVYNLSIIECEKNGVYLKLVDTWKNAVYLNHITTEYHTAYHIATCRQFVKLLEAALNENDQDIFLNAEDITNENDIITTMHFIGSKKELWNIDVVTIRFYYKLLSFHEYVNKFETLSLRSVQLENQNNKLTKQLNKLNDKYEKLTRRLDVWTPTIIQVSCNSTGHSTPVCDVNCPSDYVLISGGCHTSHHFWWIGASVKVGNGWHCRGGDDHGRNVYNQQVVGYAYCMKLNPLKVL